MTINENEIQQIISKVLQNVLPVLEKEMDNTPKNISGDVKTYVPNQTVVPKAPVVLNGNHGVFDTMEQAILSAYEAQKIYVEKFSLEKRKVLIQAIRTKITQHVEELAKMAVEETKLGRYEDKIQKIQLIVDRTPGTECLKTEAISGDDGLTIIEHAPYGVIGAITPVTNPVATIVNNVISMIAGGNTVVFNVHPSAKKVCAYTLQLINQAIEQAGGPSNLGTMVKEPTLDSVAVLSKDKNIRLLVGTGGMPMVRSLLSSGKKVVGAGSGNPPVIVDATADVKLAATEIFKGASFDNNILCLAEKEIFVESAVASDFIYHMIDAGAFLLNDEQVAKVVDLVFTYDNTPNGKEYHLKKEWVGQNASKILAGVGITGKDDCRLAICTVPHNHPFVLIEQMMPVLPIVQCANLDEAIKYAMIAENGNRHTAAMFSQSINNLTKFARMVETTIFVKNSSTLAGVGFGGEGHTTMTIAGPTGEGITDAVSFTRQRRCAIGEGGFRIV